jgi:hypothetical protein
VTVVFIVTAAAFAFGWWRLSLRWWPYAPCRRCSRRRGRNAGSKGNRWGNCKNCGGSGKRLRWGAKG